MPSSFNGLGVGLGNLYRLSPARTRSISPENFTGAKGKGGMATEGTGASAARGLGQGWKVSPSIRIEPGETRVLGEIKGSGAIQQIWLTSANLRWRDLILRIWWDDQEHPSVVSPLGDFFCCGWKRYAQVSSLGSGGAKDHAWFISFAPAYKPELAIVALVENSGFGAANAAPIAKGIYETYVAKHHP